MMRELSSIAVAWGVLTGNARSFGVRCAFIVNPTLYLIVYAYFQYEYQQLAPGQASGATRALVLILLLPLTGRYPV